VSERPGRFEEAHGGTLFLDEIGDLAQEAQAKILRAIQSKRIRRVGSNRPVDLDLRLVTATHTDLEAAVRDGEFRLDLYYRLNVMEIRLAPLRDRREDIPVLVQHFMDRFCREQYKPTLELDRETVASYLDYDWPGNVRELRNAVERAVLLAEEGSLPPFVPPSARERGATDLQQAFQQGYAEAQVKRIYAQLVYQEVQGNKSRACKILGIDYKTLQNRLSPDR
jgi:DNA-binding NtrC family response regulator